MYASQIKPAAVGYLPSFLYLNYSFPLQTLIQLGPVLVLPFNVTIVRTDEPPSPTLNPTKCRSIAKPIFHSTLTNC